MRYALQIDRQEVEKFVEEYLEKLFKFNNQKLPYIEQLSPYLNSKYLLKLQAKATLALG